MQSSEMAEGPVGPDYLLLRERVKSFDKGTHDQSMATGMAISAISFAIAGFYQPGDDDKQHECCSCHLVLRDLKPGSNPLAWHHVHSSNCAYLREKKQSNAADFNLPLPESSSASPEFGQVITTSSTQVEDREERPNRVQTHSEVQESEDGNQGLSTDTAQLYKVYNKFDQLGQEVPKEHITLIEGLPRESSINLSGFNSERQRRSTFYNWPKKDTVSVKALAASAFIYMSGLVPNDTVECVFCKVRISNWTAEMEPDAVHQKKSTYCPFVQGAKAVKNIPDPLSELLDDEDSLLPVSDREMAQNLGIIVESAKYPEFAVETRRKATFVTWAASHKKLSSEMIEHQLFYAGKGDTVCCFSCGVEMSGWVSLENIWVRHARTTPHCQLVIQEKGQDYIDEVISELGRYIEPKEEPTINTVTTRMLRPRMDNPATVAVLNMRNPAYRREDVRNALIQNIMYGRADFMRQAQPLPTVVSPPQLAEGAAEQIPMAIKPNGSSDLLYQAPIVRAIEQHKVETMLLSINSAETEDQSVRVMTAVSDKKLAYVQPPSSSMFAENVTTRQSIYRHTSALVDVVVDTPVPDETDVEGTIELVKTMKTKLMCKICLDNVVGITFLPCGHLVCCVNCAPAMLVCPLCRKEWKGIARAYLDKLAK